jgi:NAD(P)H dehydrogenase (quinone)
MPNPLESRLLVTGAGGHLGRRIIDILRTSGAKHIVAATRNPDKLPDWPGIAKRVADFDDPASLEETFADVHRVLIISTDAITIPDRRKQQHRAAVDAAVRAGVNHILYTSMLNPEDSLIPFSPDHYETEQAIEKSGLGFTILRVSWYAENLLASLPSALASGKWFTSARDGRINYVAREDVARAAAAALASGVARSQRLDITGLAAQTIEQIAAIASRVAKKPIDVVQVSDEQLANGLLATGMPPFVVRLLVASDANVRAGKFDVESDAVKRLTGQEPQQLESFLVTNRAALGV